MIEGGSIMSFGVLDNNSLVRKIRDYEILDDAPISMKSKQL